MNLARDKKDLYSENCKTVMKEIERDLHKRKDMPRSWIGRIHVVKMSLLPKAFYRVNATPNKILTTFFSELERLMLKFVRNHQSPRIAKEISRESKVGDVTGPDVELYRGAVRIETAWRGRKNRHLDQRNGAEIPGTRPHL